MDEQLMTLLLGDCPVKDIVLVSRIWTIVTAHIVIEIFLLSDLWRMGLRDIAQLFASWRQVFVIGWRLRYVLAAILLVRQRGLPNVWIIMPRWIPGRRLRPGIWVSGRWIWLPVMWAFAACVAMDTRPMVTYWTIFRRTRWRWYRLLCTGRVFGEGCQWSSATRSSLAFFPVIVK